MKYTPFDGVASYDDVKFYRSFFVCPSFHSNIITIPFFNKHYSNPI